LQIRFLNLGFFLLSQLASHKRSEVIQIFCYVLTGVMIDWEEYSGFLLAATVETLSINVKHCVNMLERIHL
jgi:hypothetical protein